MKCFWNLVVIVVAVTGVSSVAAAPPQAVHYQGYLTDVDGQPLDETVDMEFRLYEAEVAGEAFWESAGPLGVDVEDGVFRVNLAPVMAEQFAGGEVWLGITVIPSDPEEPTAEMEPRLKVLSVPYALIADHAATADIAVEAAAVTNVDFNIFATGNDVQDVLGVCIQEADLTVALEGYCGSPCYGDADVELFVTENGYVTLDVLAQWVEENVIVEPDEGALAAYLAENGYMTEEDLLWFLGEAGYPDADSVVLRDGSKSLQGDWDVGGNQLLNAVIHNAASDTPPEEPIAGQLWWDTTEKLMRVFDGQDWKNVGGGEVAFASDCDTVDGLDSTAFEPAGAVAAHEATYGHLSSEQLAVLVAGEDSNADALHTHETKGGLSNLNQDLLNTVFTKEHCSKDTPEEAPTDFGQVTSSLQLPEAGTIISATLGVKVSHFAPQTLVPTLAGPESEVKLSDVFQLDATGDWEFDLTPQLKGKESAGSWNLKILDMGEDDGSVTLETWCLAVEYMSSDTIDVPGNLTVNDMDVVTMAGLPLDLTNQAAINELRTATGQKLVASSSTIEAFTDPSGLYDLIDVDLSTAIYNGAFTMVQGIYDDFNDDTVDHTKWETTGDVSESGGVLVVEGQGSSLKAKSTFDSVARFHINGVTASQDSNNGCWAIVRLLVNGAQALQRYKLSPTSLNPEIKELDKGTTSILFHDGFLEFYNNGKFLKSMQATPPFTLHFDMNWSCENAGANLFLDWISLDEFQTEGDLAIYTNPVPFGSNAESLFLTALADVPVGTSLVYDISFDDGGSWTSGLAPGKLMKIDDPGTEAVLRFTMSTTAAHLTPKLYGFSFQSQ